MSKKTILMVEDDADIRAVLRMLIEMSGYEVQEAENGQVALDFLQKSEKPCLILLDLMMPVMDGWGFAEAVSKNEKLKDIPIVIVTAFAEDAHNIKNAQAILRKPPDVNHLKSMIQRFCH